MWLVFWEVNVYIRGKEKSPRMPFVLTIPLGSDLSVDRESEILLNYTLNDHEEKILDQSRGDLNPIRHHTIYRQESKEPHSL